jgi:hypothetical protein
MNRLYSVATYQIGQSSMLRISFRPDDCETASSEVSRKKSCVPLGREGLQFDPPVILLLVTASNSCQYVVGQSLYLLDLDIVLDWSEMT